MKQKHNVLLITADQWRGDCVSALRHPCVQTPNIDRLIEDGIAFNRHYSVCAPCGPARASLLTGLYMQNHRSVRNGTPLDDRHSNLARELRKAGYRPVLFGYTDTTLDPRVYPEQQVREYGYESIMPGFEEGLYLPSEHPEKWLAYLRSCGYLIRSTKEAFAPIENYSAAKQRGRTFSPPVYTVEESQTAFLTRAAMQYIENSEKGWFVHLSYFRPHPPFIAPEPYNSLYDPADVPMPYRAESSHIQAKKHPWLACALSPLGDWYDPWMQKAIDSPTYDHEMRQIRATYYGLISKVDHYIGQLIGHLKRCGQYENTLIIVTSDHGELLGDSWLFGKRGYFDGGYHIPLIIRDPSQTPTLRGRIVNAFTESVDVMPTILNWLDLPIPQECDGYSLIPFVHDTHRPNWRNFAFWEYDFRDVLDPTLEQQLNLTMNECSLNVIRNQRYKYVHFTALPPLFFDLQNDPAELNNLAANPVYATKIFEMSQQLLSLRMRHDEPAMSHIDISRERIFQRELKTTVSSA